MKAFLISDHAKWCALMMNGKKNVEVRKGTALYKATQKLIDEYGFAEFYVYCTKDKKSSLHYSKEYGAFNDLVGGCEHYSTIGDGCGKVLFKFRCYKVEEINRYCTGRGISYKTETLNDIELCDKSCLDLIEIDHYLYFKKGCVIHVSDLEIFDKPKELSEFWKQGEYCKNKESIIKREWLCEWCNKPNCIGDKLTKAPQSWCYVEALL